MNGSAEARQTAIGAARFSVRDVCELAKPRLSLMVVLTTVVGFIIAPGATVDGALLIHAALGTALAAAGASALNQAMEWRFDALMTRTAKRPIPAGRVSARDAGAVGVASAAVGVAYLALGVNVLTAGLALATVLIYLLIYTPLKRVTPFCTVIGAVPGALPIMMGWAARTGEVDAGAWVLFGILFAWQLPHFLAIAVMYLDDYARAGFPMLPVVDRSAPCGGLQRASGSSSSNSEVSDAATGSAPPVLPARSATGQHAVGWCAALLVISVLPAFWGLAGTLYAVGAALIGGVYLFATVVMAVRRTRTAARALFLTSLAYLPAVLTWLAFNRIG